ncbi:MAG: Cytochrome c biosis protein Ccs1 [Planctomycetota bacterium]
MTMEQGGATNYLELRETSGFLGKINGPELAFSDLSNPKSEKVVVIPNHLIRNKGKLSDPALPFDIEVLEYMNNSSISENTSQGNLATKGDGMSVVAISKPEVSGTSSDQKIDLPSAYIRLIDKKSGQENGVYLASVWLSLSSTKPTQEVTTSEGQKLQMALRMKRSYKPFQMELIEFKHERYLGTNTPKNFSSKVKLVDPARNDSFETLISMNNPLRYEGETFYQSGFLPGDKGTILQVVRNPGWLLPYLSCAMVSFGMLIHFGMHLNQFMKKRAENHAS